MLEELGVAYTLKMLPFPPRLFAREFLKLNPLGTVPYFVDTRNAVPVEMTQSGAICQYLCATYPYHPSLEVESSHPAFGSYLDWLHMSDTTLTFPLALVLRYKHFEPNDRKNPDVVKDYTRWWLARLRAVDSALQNSDYLCAGRFTAADVSVGYSLMLGSHLDGVRESMTPRVQAYWERLQLREGYQRALAAQLSAAENQNVPTKPSPDLRLGTDGKWE
jgi:glutathione S-transferase